MRARRAIWSFKSVRAVNDWSVRAWDVEHALHRICETQAATIVNRYPSIRIASLRPSWVIPSRDRAKQVDPERRKHDLWGWVQSEATAEAFLRAIISEGWSGHEAFFVTATCPTEDEGPASLYEKYWSHVPIKPGKTLNGGFFDCSKAQRLLGWVHP